MAASCFSQANLAKLATTLISHHAEEGQLSRLLYPNKQINLSDNLEPPSNHICSLGKFASNWLV